MNKNSFFSPGRFARLFRNDLLINQKTYLFTLAGIGIAIYALLYFSMVTTKHVSLNQYTGFIVFYLMGVGVVIGTAFPALTNQTKMSNYLLAPGSTLEKYLVQFIIRIVIFVPIALLIFWISAHLAKASLVPDPKIGFNPEVSITDFSFESLFNLFYYKDIAPTILGIFSMYAFLFAGSVSFNRFALPKTLIFAGGILITMFFSLVLFSHIFYPLENHGFEIKLEPYKVGDIDSYKVFLYCWACLSWPFFLLFAYFKLKEKEV